MDITGLVGDDSPVQGIDVPGSVGSSETFPAAKRPG
jgi:hypothetical protein